MKKTLSKTDRAWLAGFFEGEGWIWFRRGHKELPGFYVQPTLGLAQKNKKPLEWARRHFGGKVSPKYKDGRLYCWHWVRTGRDFILMFLDAIYPFLHFKRREVRIATALVRSLLPRGRLWSQEYDRTPDGRIPARQSKKLANKQQRLYKEWRRASPRRGESGV